MPPFPMMFSHNSSPILPMLPFHTFLRRIVPDGLRRGASRFVVTVADERHFELAERISAEIESSAKVRGTGIAKRSPEYIRDKMREGKAVIAFSSAHEWAGFCYIETWGHGKFVANSGLIVVDRFRHSGLAGAIKRRVFVLSRARYPQAKLFGLTTSLAVMKINSDLGYVPVTYSELTDDEVFWSGCRSCVNHEILESKERKNCLCTAMLYDPDAHTRRSAALLRHVVRAAPGYARYRKWRDRTLLRAIESRSQGSAA